MHNAVFGARRRIIGLSSPVATTVTALALAQPSASSRNSRTSRPRSPTRAMTALSKPCERASMPSRVDLPMPEPAKMPTRCPAHSGVNRSMTLTPVCTSERTRWRCMGAGGSRSVERLIGPCNSGPLPSIGAPSALMTRAFQDGIRIERDEAPMPGNGTKTGLGCRLERLDGDARRVDADHFAELDAAGGLQFQALAELDDAGQSGNPIVGRRYLADDAGHGDLRFGHSPSQPMLEAAQSVAVGRCRHGGEGVLPVLSQAGVKGKASDHGQPWACASCFGVS